MRVVVTGASGLLGRAIYSHFVARSHDVLGLANSRAEPPLVKQDLLDEESLKSRLSDYKPDLIVHSAAERRPDVVQQQPERSQELNVDVPGRLAAISGEIGAKLIYISTDYVFDGSRPPYTVESEPNPLNAYGTSKLLGERAVKENGRDGQVTSLRVPVLYGDAASPSESAVNVLRDAIIPPSDGRVITMDAYAVRYPTNVKDVARVIAEIAEITVTESKPLPPILHYQATEAMTKYDMCNVMSRLQNRFAPPLSEASVSHLDPEFEVDPMAATARPRHCKMDTSILKEYGVELSHTTFEDWWSAEFSRLAQEERLRIERQREEEEQERQRAEEEEARRRKEVEEAEAEALRQRQIAEEAEAQRKKAEEEKAKKHAEEEARLRADEEAKEADVVTQEAQEIQRVKEDDQNDSPEDVTDDAQVSTGKGSKSQAAVDGSKADASSTLDSAGLGEQTTSQELSTNELEAAGASSDKNIGSSDTTPSAASASRPQEGPSSPNPSFSSLRGRPTPPGTSEVRSPSSSQPSSLRNVEGVVPPQPTKNAGPPTPSKRSDQDTKDLQTTPLTHRPNPFRKPWNEDGKSEFPNQIVTDTSSAPTQADARVPTTAETDEDEAIYGVASPHPDRSAGDTGISSTLKNGYGEIEIGVKTGTSESRSSQTAAAKSDLSGEASRDKPSPTQATFTIRVGDPHKVGDGMTGHMVYTVRTKTDAAGFKAAQFSSLRRYSDFRWLHAALVHNNAGIIIPPVPEKVRGLISRFSPDLVEARRHGLENCINKIANHPILSKDEDLKLFLESEDFNRDVKLRVARKGAVPTPEQKTWMGWSGTVGVNSGQKFHEFDEWFDNQRAYLDSLEAQLKQMVKCLNALAQSHKELSDTIASSSHAMMMLSGSSLSRSLSASFAGLGDLQRRAQELEDVQSDSDIRHLGSVLYEYERVVGSVRKAFSTRVDTWHSMQKGDDELRKARIKHDKLKRESAASHYHEESLRDLAEIESRALERRSNFDLVSKRCKEEMTRFDKERVEDVRKSIDVWLTGQLERREELLEEWIDYASKCLSLDLRDDEQKQRDRGAEDRREEANAQEQLQDSLASDAIDHSSKEDIKAADATSAEKPADEMAEPPSKNRDQDDTTDASASVSQEATAADEAEAKKGAASESATVTEAKNPAAALPAKADVKQLGTPTSANEVAEQGGAGSPAPNVDEAKTE